MKNVFSGLAFCLLMVCSGSATADQITKPHNFTAGTPASAEEVNANFDTVYDQVNKVGAVINVDTFNNVGIGTATPAGELHVTKPQVMGAVAFNGTGVNDIAINDSGYSGTGTTRYKVVIQDSGPAVDVIRYSSDDGATWSETVDMVASGLDIGFGVTIGFSALDGHDSEDKWEWSVSQGFADGLIVSDGTVTVKNIAITTGASAGRVLTSDNKGNASWQATPVDYDMDSGNELNESFTLTGTLLEIEDNGGLLEVDLGSLVNDADADPNNEFQVLSRIGTNIYLTPVGGTVSIADNDNDSTNELITSFSMGSGVLQLSDAAGTRFIDFSEKLSINSLTDAKTDITSLFLGSGTGAVDDGSNYNIAVGPSAMAANTTGIYNVASGYSALGSNTSGGGNTANGHFALYSNTTGSNNTASGKYTLVYNTSGADNIASGAGALFNNTTAGNNTAIGSSALYTQSYSNTNSAWDSENTAVGFETLYSNQPTATNTGYRNTAIGAQALRSNTWGFYNTASGYKALYANTTGAANTANGYQALLANISGEYNTANGYATLTSNTTGNFNTALGGRYALASNTIGSYNTAIGTNALYLNSTSGKNTALGMSALYSQSYSNSGTAFDSNNTAVGYEALYSNQPTATSNGNVNTALGNRALRANTTGSRNTASGFEALLTNTTGRFNTATGYEALYSNTSGEYNLAIGSQALYANTTGSYNTGIGFGADVTANNLTNATAIGFMAQVNASNKVRIGNSSVTLIEGQVGWSFPSDFRLKKEVEDIPLGLDFIKSLRPVEYKLKEGNDRIDFGFVAQDIEELLGTDYNVLGIGEDAERRLSLRYTDFIAPMVKAMQEQQEIIETQQAQIAALIKRIEALEKK